jgi:hypothetical protein
MNIPVLRNAKYASQCIRKSVRWLYEEARQGRVDCTRIGRSVWWTDTQIAKIINDAAQDAKREATPTKAPRPAPEPKTQRRAPSPTPKPANKAGIPQADFTVSRLYKKGAA